MSIGDANEELELGLPEGEYETVAGFVLSPLGRISEQGEQVFSNGPPPPGPGGEGAQGGRGGAPSGGELADVSLNERVAPAEILSALRPALPAGLEALAAAEVGLAAPALQTQVRW